MSIMTLLRNYTATVKDFYAAFERGDIPVILERLADDVEWDIPGERSEIPSAGHWHGKAQVAEFFGALGRSMEMDPLQLREFIAQGDSVVALGSYTGKAKSTGRRFEADFAMVWTFRGDQVVRFQEYMDPASLKAALKP